MSSLPVLPFFPLNLVAFPNEDVALHIFEPRYQALFGQLESGELESFVIVPHVGESLRSRATELELVEVARSYESGEMDVKARGIGVIEVVGFQPTLDDQLYAGGEIERLPFDLESSGGAEALELHELCGDLMRALGVHRDLPAPDSVAFSFGVGHRLGLTVEQEFGLLTLPKEHERLLYLLGLVRTAIVTAEKASAMKRRVQMNGHFRYLQGKR